MSLVDEIPIPTKDSLLSDTYHAEAEEGATDFPPEDNDKSNPISEQEASEVTSQISATDESLADHSKEPETPLGESTKEPELPLETTPIAAQETTESIDEKASNNEKEAEKVEQVTPAIKVAVKKVAPKKPEEVKKTSAVGSAKAPIKTRTSAAPTASAVKRVASTPARPIPSTTTARSSTVAKKPAVPTTTRTSTAAPKPTPAPARKPPVPTSTLNDPRIKRAPANARPSTTATPLSRTTSNTSVSRTTTSKSPAVKEVRIPLNGTRRVDPTEKAAPKKSPLTRTPARKASTEDVHKTEELEKKNLELQELNRTQGLLISGHELAIKQAQEKISQLEAKISEAEVEALRSKQADSENLANEKIICDLKAELESERSRQEETVALINRQMTEISEQLELVKAKAAESEQLKDKHHEKFLEETEKATKLESELESLKQTHNALVEEKEKSLCEAEQKVDALKTELEATKTDLVDSQKALEALEASQAELKPEELEDLKAELAKVQDTKSELELELEALKKANEEKIQQIILDFEAKISSEAEASKLQREKESASLKGLVDELQKGLSMAQDEIKNLQVSLKEKEAQVQKKEDSLSESEALSSQYTKLLGDHEDLKSKLAESESITSELEAAQVQIKQLKKEKEEIALQQGDSDAANKLALAKLAHEKEQLSEALASKDKDMECLKNEQMVLSKQETQLRETLAEMEIKQVEWLAREAEFKRVQEELKEAKSVQRELSQKNMDLLQSLATQSEQYQTNGNH